jgi:hypothetical protein
VSFVRQEFAEELATQPETVKLARAIHKAWLDYPGHSTDAESVTDWDACEQYLRWKFLVAADQVVDVMHWGKIWPKELEEDAGE